MYKCNASHLLFSLYQSNARHFLFSLDYCNARLLLFSLVQDCVMATTSCFHYNKTVWCQLPLILVYRIAFECSPYSFQKNIHRDAKDLQYLSFSKKIKKKKIEKHPYWLFCYQKNDREVIQYTEKLGKVLNCCGAWLNSSNCSNLSLWKMKKFVVVAKGLDLMSWKKQVKFPAPACITSVDCITHKFSVWLLQLWVVWR